MMVRTRLVWFTIGFGSATAAMAHFVFRDLWNDRHTLSTQFKEKFDALDARLSNLENPVVFTEKSTPNQSLSPNFGTSTSSDGGSGELS